MVVNPDDQIPFLQWVSESLATFGLTVVILLLVGIFLCFIVTVVRHGPREAMKIVLRILGVEFFRDIANSSIARTWAITRLVIIESLKRRILLAVFLLVSVLFLLAGWYVGFKNDNPARLYISFVLNSSTLLILALAILLSSFSLGNDIRSRTIYTIMTKPVRPQELFVGRVLGFIGVCSALLLFMWIISYQFVVRGLRHSHKLEVGQVEYDKKKKANSGSSSLEANHRHKFEVQEDDGSGHSHSNMGHFHAVEVDGRGEDAKVTFGPADGQLQARIPVYGKLGFRDRTGRAAETGISVGKEWTYRSYIEGDTLHTAIWKFEGVTEKRFPKTLPVELTLRVFRTTKGDIVSGIRGSLRLANTKPGADVQRTLEIPFTAVEFATQRIDIDLEDLYYQDDRGTVQKLDFYEQLVDEDGRIALEIQCVEYGQFFGMSQGDLYLRADDASFLWNFTKAFIGIWLQVVLVVSFGVVLSTFLSGPVTMLSVVCIILLGNYRERLISPIDKEAAGPIESIIRVLTQPGEGVDLSLGELPMAIMKFCDDGFKAAVQAISSALPDFGGLNTSDHVANGFNIYGGLVLRHGTTAFCYFFIISVFGYFLLKTREIAA